MSINDSTPLAVDSPSTSEPLAGRASRADRVWSAALVESSARRRGRDPEERLLAVFDVLDDVINRADREARAYIGLLANDVAGSTSHAELGTLVQTLAAEANLEARDELGLAYELLVVGAAHGAMAGDLGAGGRAGRMAVDLVARHRPRQSDSVIDYFADEYDFDFGYEQPTNEAAGTVTVRSSTTGESDAGFLSSVGYAIDPRDDSEATAELDRIVRDLDENWA